MNLFWKNNKNRKNVIESNQNNMFYWWNLVLNLIYKIIRKYWLFKNKCKIFCLEKNKYFASTYRRTFIVQELFMDILLVLSIHLEK